MKNKQQYMGQKSTKSRSPHTQIGNQQIIGSYIDYCSANRPNGNSISGFVEKLKIDRKAVQKLK